MAYVGTYLNFQLQTEEAFNWYASIFTPGVAPMFMRFSDTPQAPLLPESERHCIMHASLDIVAGHKLMATDMLASFGQKVIVGNNTTINLTLDKYGIRWMFNVPPEATA